VASTRTLKPYLDQLDQVAAKQKQAVTTTDALGMSSKQLAFATRGLPAQITDIVVSLQGGQRPMTVLLQQGGQLKDMFGGIGGAARALGGYVAAWSRRSRSRRRSSARSRLPRKGSDELRAFQKQATLTGNAIGLSASGSRSCARARHRSRRKGRPRRRLRRSRRAARSPARTSSRSPKRRS
jgi:phage-related minor tail protein